MTASRAMRQPLPLRRCDICGEPYAPWRPNQKFCGERCRQLAYNPRKLAVFLKAVFRELGKQGLVRQDILRLVDGGP